MNFIVVIFLIVGGLWVLGIFFSYVTGIGKTFKSAPIATIESTKNKNKIHEAALDAKQKQRKIMEDMKDKISDSKRNFNSKF